MTAALWRTLAARRNVVQVAADATAWVVGIEAALTVRFDSFGAAWAAWPVAPALAVALVSQLLAGLVFGLYVGRWRFGSFDEVAALARTVVAVSSVLLIGSIGFASPLVPRTVAVGSGLVALVVMAGARYGWRSVVDRRRRPADDALRVVVFGAGEGGALAVNTMVRDPDSEYVPVALLDDDPAKRRLRISGVPVLGGRSCLAQAKERYGAELLVVAIPSADSRLVRDLSKLALDVDLPMRVLPPVRELLHRDVTARDIRLVSEVDLLGRQRIDTDIETIAGYLTGRRVLVTGAGGSIGSELCRQVARFGPASLVLLDRDESALHSLQLELEGRALLDSRCLVVADIRDAERMLEVFAEHRPEVVFHAAALKHLPLLEMHPAEAVKTNVVGTRNVLDAASVFDVVRFVNISTDKAAAPTSVLGFTKRIAERLTASYAARNVGTYLSVRFGNVLGSRGSMLGAFERQVAAGGPITVTHPDVTRYFMTVHEAVQLVVQAGAVGSDGEALVLDMGEPVRILDVARRLAAEAPEPIDIVFTGLRDGEKLHEVLLGPGERDVRPVHSLLAHVPVPLLPDGALGALEAGLPDDDRLRMLLATVADTEATIDLSVPGRP